MKYFATKKKKEKFSWFFKKILLLYLNCDECLNSLSCIAIIDNKKKGDTMIRFASFNPNIQGLILFSTSYFLSWMDEKKDVALGQFPQASFLKEDKGIK